MAKHDTKSSPIAWRMKAIDQYAPTSLLRRQDDRATTAPGAAEVQPYRQRLTDEHVVSSANRRKTVPVERHIPPERVKAVRQIDSVLGHKQFDPAHRKTRLSAIPREALFRQTRPRWTHSYTQ